MRKILLVFGTRPEAIKMAPLYIALKKNNKFDVKVCVTAQHREMLDQVLHFFNIIADYDLNIMQNSQSLFDITSNILTKISHVYEKVKPDYVFVQGDTTTAFVSALAAFYSKTPVCHIEAGLRTNEMYFPFPEEINRQLISRLAYYHFAPTETAKKNLLQENIPANKIFITGNTVIDALYETRHRIENQPLIGKKFSDIYKVEFNENVKNILVTLHRRENIGEKLVNICKALRTIAQAHSNIQLIFPVHKNPKVRTTVYQYLKGLHNCFLIDPVEYKYFIWLMLKSFMIISDSGGVQEEAPALGKPVLLVRDTTERPEAINVGNVKLIGTNEMDIVCSVEKLLNDANLYKRMSRPCYVYGDGYACQRIIEQIQ